LANKASLKYWASDDLKVHTDRATQVWYMQTIKNLQFLKPTSVRDGWKGCSVLT